MSYVLQSASGQVRAAWWWEEVGPGAPLQLADRLSARALLARIGAEPGEMARLRRLAAQRVASPFRGLADGEVLDRLAGWLSTRELRLWRIERDRLISKGDVEEELPPPSFHARAPEPEIEEAPVEDDTFFPGIDAAGLAEVLSEASEHGVAFCEECQKAPPPEPETFPEDLDAEAAAGVLVLAAESGVPFCEECEKAKARGRGAGAQAGQEGAAES